jgi:glycosyltransferase involved in cell wall biosynthesis
MRVLLQIRHDALTRPGGDTVQVHRTAEALRALGVEAEVSQELRPELRGRDVVHVFNMTAPAEPLEQATWARTRGLPVALSTVYWPQDEYYRLGERRPFWRGWLRRARLRWTDAGAAPPALAFQIAEARHGREALQRKLLDAAGVWLPNAEAEHAEIVRAFGFDRPTVVVPNAVDPSFADADPALFRAQHAVPETFLLCAARVEPRKNLLALVQAAGELATPLVVIGWIASEPYWRTCLAAARAPLIHVAQSPPALVASAMAAAAVHVLPSWYETPGLSSLEAALAGTRVVSTDRGSAREYLGDLAHYCDPTSVPSIVAAIRASLAGPPSPALRQLVATRYTWEEAAKATLRGYETLLARGRA